MGPFQNQPNIQIFIELSEEQRSAFVLPLIVERMYRKGETVLTQGENSTNVFFIIDGRVRSTTYSMSGKEICFQHLDQGEMFGELSAIDKHPRTTSVVTEVDCMLGVMKAEDLWHFMQEYPSVMAAVLLRMTSMVRFLCSRVYEYGALGTRERTRTEIIRLAKQNTSGSKNSAVIEKMPTHEDIANRIASHREAVTKEISFLRKSGLIKNDGRALVVPDIQALVDTVMESVL